MRTVKLILAFVILVANFVFAADDEPRLIPRGAAANGAQAQTSNPASESGQKLLFGSTESVEPDQKTGGEYHISNGYFQLTIPGVTDVSQITPEEKDTVLKAGAIFSLLDPRVLDQKADRERLQQQLNQAPDFEHQVAIMQTWISEEEAKGFTANEDNLKANSSVIEPVYIAPDPHDPEWFKDDGTPKILIHSSDWGKAKVDQTFHGRTAFLERTSKMENGNKTVNEGSPVIARIFTAANGTIPPEKKVQIRDAIAQAIQNPGDFRHVGESEELSSPEGDGCRVFIKDNYFPGGVVRNEVYDKCHDPKGFPPVKGIPIRTDAVVDSNGQVLYPAETYWIAEICTNPVIILQRPGRIRVETKLTSFKPPAFTGTPGGGGKKTTSGGDKPIVPVVPAAVVPPQPQPCFLYNKEHPGQAVDMDDIQAGTDFIYDMQYPWVFMSGTMVHTDKKNKGKVVDIVGSDWSNSANGYSRAIAHDVPEGTYDVEFMAVDSVTKLPAGEPCRGRVKASKNGKSHFWAGFAWGFGAGAGAVLLACYFAGGCFGGGHVPAMAPKTANDGSDGNPPGRTGRR